MDFIRTNNSFCIIFITCILHQILTLNASELTIKPGDSDIDLQRAIGKPNGVIKSGAETIWEYSNGDVVLTNGVIKSISAGLLKSQRQPQPEKSPMPPMASTNRPSPPPPMALLHKNKNPNNGAISNEDIIECFEGSLEKAKKVCLHTPSGRIRNLLRNKLLSKEEAIKTSCHYEDFATSDTSFILQRAASGEMGSMFDAYRMFRAGIKSPGESMAFQYLKQCVELGMTAAIAEYGMLEYTGAYSAHVPQNIPNALKKFEATAALRDPVGCYGLYLASMNPYTTEVHLLKPESRKLLDQAASAGHRDALSLLGHYEFSESKTPTEEEHAISLLTRAALNGDGNSAATLVKWCTAKGRPKEFLARGLCFSLIGAPEAAKAWKESMKTLEPIPPLSEWEFSLQMEDAFTLIPQERLIQLAMEGQLTSEQTEKVFELLKSHVDNSFTFKVSCCLRLAEMLKKGIGTPTNIREAYYYYAMVTKPPFATHGVSGMNEIENSGRIPAHELAELKTKAQKKVSTIF